LKKNNTLILGLGNEILTDDAIGPRLTGDLSNIYGNTVADFIIAGSGGLEIMEMIKGYRRVIIIDSIHTSGGKPGDVYHLNPSDFKETSHLSNIHDVSFLAALDLGKMIDYTMPDAIHIIAVEIVDAMEFSERFTPVIEEKYPEILMRVSLILRKILE
jgi:hydrogenase maturation protease